MRLMGGRMAGQCWIGNLSYYNHTLIIIDT